MNAPPEIPLTMLITVMDRYRLQSSTVKERWRDTFKYWIWNGENVMPGYTSDRINDIAFLRVLHLCEPPGRKRDELGRQAVSLLQQWVVPRKK
ncbi:hypothetical protein [Lysobacter sp. M15]|uniref:hypothetical protein n=1 Tax=Lysobacter sp. M15 TaxID=2916837 RepID=UPI001F55CFE1|nr:hypothetical protein [Lysobacter sp. M15]